MLVEPVPFIERVFVVFACVCFKIRFVNIKSFPKSKHINTQSNKMAFVPIDETYVLNAIKKLENGKAPGPDKISTKQIKDAAVFIWKPLTMVFNSSLKFGIFPDI